MSVLSTLLKLLLIILLLATLIYIIIILWVTAGFVVSGLFEQAVVTMGLLYLLSLVWDCYMVMIVIIQYQ